MSKSDYSKSNYFAFLDYVSAKGLVKNATAKNWKNASIRLLAIESDDESQDMRELNIDDLCSRFMNLEGKSVTPSSMQVYRSRFKSAVNDFIAYTNNPMAYKPGISQRSSRKKASKNGTSGASNTNNQNNKGQQSGQEHNPHPKNITFPIPLRSDLVVEIKHLPHDLTEQEAEKISMVIKALAMNKG